MAIITDVDIRRAAMDLLARREHGAQELVQKLVKRFNKYKPRSKKDAGSDEQALDDLSSVVCFENLTLEERVEAAVARLTEEGLQSDERLAEAFIRSRANRGQGPVKIKMELRQKGISDALIGLAMEEADQDWYALAADVATRKFADFEGKFDSDPKERARRSRFLQQRGFCFDHISSIDGV
jgi:regulatory protein